MNVTKRKKILFLITKSNLGGAQRYVYDLATNLPKDAFEVVVALGGNGVLINMLEEANIRVIKLKSLQRNISLLKELKSFFALNKIIKDEKPDILHVNSSKAGGIGSFVGRLRRTPKIIYTAHGWAFNENRSTLSKFLVSFLHWTTIILSHKTICVSKALKTQMRWPFVQRKIHVIHNGRKHITPLSKESARTEIISKLENYMGTLDGLWTGTIAELHPIKCHHIAITAIKVLVENGIKIKHIIIGSGEEESSLKEMVTNLSLENNVFFTGSIIEASKLLKAFDIFVLPSNSEALGYVLIEAGQAGLPIVASNVGGIPEIVSNGVNGTLVTKEDPYLLSEAITSLIENPTKRIAYSNSISESIKHFSIERMVEETVSLYN